MSIRRFSWGPNGTVKGYCEVDSDKPGYFRQFGLNNEDKGMHRFFLGAAGLEKNLRSGFWREVTANKWLDVSEGL